MSETVVVEVSERIQIIRLNRPEKKNALTREMYARLAERLEAANASDDIAVSVLMGSGGVFSAGNDIGEFLSGAVGGGAVGGVADNQGEPAGEVLRFLDCVAGTQKPLIAAVDGLAVGVGTTLLFHCDLVYASPSATFSTPFLDLGLVPEAGSSLLMPMRMGYARAFEMLVLGERFDAARMVDAGLVNRIVAAEDLEATALAAAARLAAKPPRALSISRQLMRGGRRRLTKCMREESKAFAERLSSPEAVEAFTAFVEGAADVARVPAGIRREAPGRFRQAQRAMKAA